MTVGRLDAVSGGWSVFWNELLDGAPANRHQRVAAGMTRTGKLMTARSATAAWFDSMLGKIDPSPSGRLPAELNRRPNLDAPPRTG